MLTWLFMELSFPSFHHIMMLGLYNSDQTQQKYLKPFAKWLRFLFLVILEVFFS